MIRLTLFAVLALLAPAVHAQVQPADALMDAFAATWSADDVDGLRALLADDVYVVDNDAHYDGADAVVAAWTGNMEATGAMTITPLRSGADAATAYQVGEWTIAMGDQAITGTHQFVFRLDADGYRLAAVHIRSDG